MAALLLYLRRPQTIFFGAWLTRFCCFLYFLLIYVAFQVEGAFVMGVGYWTTEEVVHDRSTGELMNDRTWNYHVPQGTDIPQDFRIYFRKKSLGNDMILGAKGIDVDG